MSQLLASLEDIEEIVGTPVNDEVTARAQVEAYRTVKSQLAPKYPPVVLAGWSNPEHTPERIRKIAAKLVVAYMIGQQELYQEAIDELRELANGPSDS